VRRARYKAEATSLADSRLAAIVESSDDAIIGTDLNGIVSSWNAGAETLFGYSAQEMVGASILRLIPSDLLDEERSILKKVSAGGKIKHLHTVRKAKNGVRLKVSLTVSPIRNAEGAIIGVAKKVCDIGEQELLEEQVTSFFTASLDLLGITGPKGCFTKVNPAFLKTLGYSEAEVFSRPFLDFVHPDDRAANMAAAAKGRSNSDSTGSSPVSGGTRCRCRNAAGRNENRDQRKYRGCGAAVGGVSGGLSLQLLTRGHSCSTAIASRRVCRVSGLVRCVLKPAR
jgi:PAS domain S-box-containing protein